MKIIHNRAKCRLCGDVIESQSVHDFRMCKCGEIFVDGGHEYFRWGAMRDANNAISLAEYEEGGKLVIDNGERSW